jgi:hypothetical protein
MRFAGGALVQRRRGRLYQVQRYWIAGIEQFYLVTFCLPRFLDQTFEEKFVTIFHELYHVSPAFNGDLRRHAGRCCLHTTSQKQFDRSMAELAAAYLRGGADPELYTFLRYNFAQLRRHTDGVVGQVLPMPKLVPVG